MLTRPIILRAAETITVSRSCLLVVMSTSLRSKGGCWTCRLRRKKCDEGKPECTTCRVLSITCHGYGPKPDWMDNGDAEKEMVDSLKHIVRHTSRRTYRYRGPSVTKVAPKLAPKAPSSDAHPDAAPAPAPVAHTDSTAASTPSTNASRWTETTPPSDSGFTEPVVRISDNPMVR